MLALVMVQDLNLRIFAKVAAMEGVVVMQLSLVKSRRVSTRAESILDLASLWLSGAELGSSLEPEDMEQRLAGLDDPGLWAERPDESGDGCSGSTSITSVFLNPARVLAAAVASCGS